MDSNSSCNKQKLETTQMSTNRSDKHCRKSIELNTTQQSKEKLLVHVTTWTILKIIILSKRSQTKTNSECMIVFTQNSKKFKLM